VRAYASPAPRWADLVLAGRALVAMQTAGAPFFSMDTLPFTDDPRTGLGGQRTMRGFRQNRFVGRVMALANGEVRWTFARTTLWKQRLGFIAAPFLDVGRAFDAPGDDAGDPGAGRWRASYGGALRISWNLATLVTADYGMSDEDAGLYINFGHMF
jgi:outer membrane protein assembly factor BamA